MTFRNEHGSIMLEAVLVLPLFVLIVFFVIQMTFVWTAKQMTYYAAYCGARAALVYNPADYGAEKQGDGGWSTGGFVSGGVVHRAACTVLSWVSWSIGGYDMSGGHGLFYSTSSALNELKSFKIGAYTVPLSSNVSMNVMSVREAHGCERTSAKARDGSHFAASKPGMFQPSGDSVEQSQLASEQISSTVPYA